MLKARTLAAVAAGMMIVGGCSIASEVEALKKMPSKGDAFMHALQMEYAGLAGAADARGADDSAEMYYNKGKMAAEGKKVDPLSMKDRKLPKNVDDEVEAGRIALVAILRGGGPKKAPKQTAVAQASFDCWMEESAKEKPSAKDVKACRDGFDKALKQAEDLVNK
jgi:OmpA-OmpF porin, OOP family